MLGGLYRAVGAVKSGVFRNVVPSIQSAGFKKMGNKIIKVYEPLPPLRDGEPLMKTILQSQNTRLDPKGLKTQLLDSSNPKRLRAGDVIRINYRNFSRAPLNGTVIAITRAGLTSSILIRNKVNRIGVEHRIPLFNPIIERIDILSRPAVYKRRAKHYYIRNNRLDVKEVTNSTKKK